MTTKSPINREYNTDVAFQENNWEEEASEHHLILQLVWRRGKRLLAQSRLLVPSWSFNKNWQPAHHSHFHEAHKDWNQTFRSQRTERPCWVQPLHSPLLCSTQILESWEAGPTKIYFLRKICFLRFFLIDVCSLCRLKEGVSASFYHQ